MAVVAGPSPWSSGYRRVTKSSGKKLGAYSDPRNNGRLTYGWVSDSNDAWDKNPTHYATHKITLPNGRIVSVPVDDYKHFLENKEMYTKLYDNADNKDIDIGDYIDTAFSKDSNGKYTRSVTAFDGVGHIKLIEYSAARQLMQVTFTTNNAVVVYFRVPTAVVGELKYLASSGGMRDGHHWLGIRFWDLVRVRGTIHGGRYAFRYVKQGDAIQVGRYSEHDNVVGNAKAKEVKNAVTGKIAKDVHATKVQQAKRASYKSDAYYAPFASDINGYKSLLKPSDQELFDSYGLADRFKLLVDRGIIDDDWFD